MILTRFASLLVISHEIPKYFFAPLSTNLPTVDKSVISVSQIRGRERELHGLTRQMEVWLFDPPPRRAASASGGRAAASKPTPPSLPVSLQTLQQGVERNSSYFYGGGKRRGESKCSSDVPFKWFVIRAPKASFYPWILGLF